MRTTYGPVRLLESLRIESARGVLFVGIFLALLLFEGGNWPLRCENKPPGENSGKQKEMYF